MPHIVTICSMHDEIEYSSEDILSELKKLKIFVNKNYIILEDFDINEMIGCSKSIIDTVKIAKKAGQAMEDGLCKRKKEQEAYEHKISSLEYNISELENNISELENNISELENNISELENDIYSLNSEIEELEKNS